ncbi:MAG: hypothetical protein ABIZ91_07650, partial [Gemmatimonadaceae bacterium]
KCLSSGRIAAVRQELRSAEQASGNQRRDALSGMASQLGTDSQGSCDAPKVRMLERAVRDLAGAVT